jgi:UPF0042 nucleotide-binding protein
MNVNEHDGQQGQAGDGAQVSTGTPNEAAAVPDAAIPELVIISGMSGAGRVWRTSAGSSSTTCRPL